MRGRHIGIGIAILGLLVAACSSPAPGGTGGTLDGTAWTLASYDVDGTTTPVPAQMVVDAAFAAGTVTGFAGCNTYNASATVDGAKLTVGQAATTMKACDEALTSVEAAYLAGLARSATFTAAADSLTIYDGEGRQVLVFAAGAANPLEGAWIVTGYNNGQRAVASPLDGTTLTATFTPDGQLSGSAGCNTFNGSYELDGRALTVAPLATTMMACDQEIMDQETQFLAALQAPAVVETSGAVVTLRDADGAGLVVMTRE